jgi:monothiol glutaredoxin
MSKPTITAWLKTYCGWSNGIRAVLAKYELPYEEKDIIQNPAFRWEMEQKSGQPLSPCVEVNGTMLADVSGEELEAWLLQNGVASENENTTDVPLDRACSDAEHDAMARGVPLKFQGRLHIPQMGGWTLDPNHCVRVGSSVPQSEIAVRGIESRDGLHEGTLPRRLIEQHLGISVEPSN